MILTKVDTKILFLLSIPLLFALFERIFAGSAYNTQNLTQFDAKISWPIFLLFCLISFGWVGYNARSKKYTVLCVSLAIIAAITWLYYPVATALVQ